MPVATLDFTSRGRKLRMQMDLDAARANEASIIKFLERGRHYEPDVSLMMCQIVDAGDVVIDVGANAGFFTALLGVLAGPEGRVVSFEPGANNLPRLKNNIALNNLENVMLIEQPASNMPGEVIFFINSDDSGGNALWDVATFPGNVKSAAAPQKVTMRATTLDAEIERLGLAIPKLIKIDVEGAEVQVLLGASKMLTGCKVPFVICEYHPFGLDQMGTSAQTLRSFMESLGYSTFAMYYDGAMPKLIPPGTALALPSIVNVLFSTPAAVARVWSTYFHHPGLVHPKS
ncbi:MAG: FkbM family methyltransferase [Rhodospirillaceae bacterium]